MKSIATTSVMYHLIPVCLAVLAGQFATTEQAFAQANLKVIDMEVGCSPYPYQTEVRIKVKNTGSTTANYFYVDVFFDLPFAPSVGDYSDTYTLESGLQPGQVRWVTLPVPYEYVEYRHNTWVDVVLDTNRWVPESNEFDNVYSAYVWLYCFF
jgi:hypothetical protein